MEQFNDSGSKKDLMLYRMNTAKENLAEAKILLSEKLYKGANNRAYYAIFHTINAIFALDGKSYRRHKEVLGNFNKASQRRLLRAPWTAGDQSSQS